MAKSQLRSNREPKKPKKDKAKSEPTTSGSIWRTLESQGKDQGKKK
jgi:hypothetical protein